MLKALRNAPLYASQAAMGPGTENSIPGSTVLTRSAQAAR
ncbi:hypothetical protein DEV92_10143 [Phyllobacterium myrsinacearum]|nr:hypothetical protein DEV92_10143 [Phyllobacterium myrsinacearum]